MSALSRSRLARTLFALLLRTLSRTWRIKGAPHLNGAPRVVAFRHGAMLPVWYHYRCRGAGCVISRSEDGEILAGYLQSLGYDALIRGSSSRGGGEVLQEMIDLLETRSCLITPDGPRGPAGRAKPGAVVAAVRSGRELLLLEWTARRSKRLRSWDAMEIPIPFSRIKFRYCIINPNSESENLQSEMSNPTSSAMVDANDKLVDPPAKALAHETIGDEPKQFERLLVERIIAHVDDFLQPPQRNDPA